MATDVEMLLHEKTTELSRKLSEAIERELRALATREDPPAFVALWCGPHEIEGGHGPDRATVTVNQHSMPVLADTAEDFDCLVESLLRAHRGEVLILRREGAWLPGIAEAVSNAGS